MIRIAQMLRDRAEELATLESRDNGKPLKQARADVQVAARYFEFFAGIADKIMGNTIPLGPGFLDYTVREPIGVSAQIIPWNYPIQIGARGIAPAIAAGCTVVLKPAEDAPMTAMRLGEIALECGLPPGVVNVLPGTGPEAGAALASHPDINQLTFTGSVPVGIAVAKMAADNVVPVVMELGGKSPNIVFEDADLDLTVQGVANAIFQNAGQTCSAGSRLLVQRKAHDGLVERLADRANGMRVGPGVSDPDMGPIISKKQLEMIEGYVTIGRSEGAQVAAGGGRPSARISGRGSSSSRRCSTRDAGHARRAGGDLRAGAGDHHLRRDRGGDRDREPQPVRARRRRVDARHQQGDDRRVADQGRPGLHQHLRRRRRRGAAVRRLQEERLRPREGPRVARELHTGQERLREVLLGLPRDLRFAFRTMRKSALVSATIVLCLGFSIGATGTVFAWTETLILQPLTGVKAFDRLVSLKTTTAHDEEDLSYPDYTDIRDDEARADAKTFEGLAAFSIRRINLRTGPAAEARVAEPVWGVLASANYFDVLGVKPLVGRAFLPGEDAVARGAPVVVISHALWQRRFGGDVAVIGRPDLDP